VACLSWAAPLFATDGAATQRAERLAGDAVRLAATKPVEALARAREALELTADFEPTAFVTAGRKGVVVEDAYLAARGEYRRHRATLYEAVGLCLAASQRHREAARYLRRANLLDPNGGSRIALARSLTAAGHGREALDALLESVGDELSPEVLATLSAAADAAGVPSLQAELDRARLAKRGAKPAVEHRRGPLRDSPRARLSTGEPLRLDGDGMSVFYVADASCRTCSADLTALQRLMPSGKQPLLVPVGPEQDRALRQAVSLYKLGWPFVVGRDATPFLEVDAPAVVVVGRRGWSAAVARPPLEPTLPAVLAIFGRQDTSEPLPRPAWSGRPVERRPPAPPPALRPDGLAPGEDEPAPPEFEAAAAAYRAGKPAEALRLFDALAARGDGWLLPPEARLNRALCLAALGQHEKARLWLLHTGDSRFQEDVDRALETVSAGRRPGRS
jgi:tetratricopeptide (TPR) repeat protein